MKCQTSPILSLDRYTYNMLCVGVYICIYTIHVCLIQQRKVPFVYWIIYQINHARRETFARYTFSVSNKTLKCETCTESIGYYIIKI